MVDIMIRNEFAFGTEESFNRRQRTHTLHISSIALYPRLCHIGGGVR